jgi:FtsZ-binding cell division protein ZapB
MINDKISLEKILLLQKEISELKIENNNLYLRVKECENERLMNNNNNKLKINSILPDMNKQKMKNAYRTLIEENERLKNNIIKLKEYYH